MKKNAISNWRITGGHIVDAAQGRDASGDLWIVDGRISGKPPEIRSLVLNAAGCLVMPGLLDAHTHLRDPGDPAAETLATGTAAAARGGFAGVVAMPNTRPPLDTPERVRALAQKALAEGVVSVFPCGCLTRGRAGAQAADLASLKAAGAVAVTDDGTTPLDEKLFTEIARQARSLELPILDHAEDTRYSGGGVMHAGRQSRRLGLPGIPVEAEVVAVDRDIRVAAKTGCHLHIQHVSSSQSVERIRRAQDRGIPVSGEVTPHHLAFCDEDVVVDDTRFKMNPPLRGKHDRKALRLAVLDGTLAVLATDHAPHAEAFPPRDFLNAPFGVIGLETALAVTFTLLVVDAGMPLTDWLRCWTTGPARVLNISPPRLAPGEAADMVVFDPNAKMPVEAALFRSRSANSPFIGREYRGKVVATIVHGKMAWFDEEEKGRLTR